MDFHLTTTKHHYASLRIITLMTQFRVLRPVLFLFLSTFSRALLAADSEVPPPGQAAPLTRLPVVTVTGTNSAASESEPLKEEQLVGPNRQPEWTTQRRFATTRIYVLPPWQVEFEQWWKGKFPRHGKSDQLFQSELGIGLPYRLQLDVYENVERTPERSLQHQGNQVELRYAFAEWGKIPLNPTLYGEWKFNHRDPDAYELKLLLGDDFAPGWHWGFNAFYEQEVGGGRGSEGGASFAVSRTLIDEKLSLGVETNLERRSGPNLDGKPEVEFLVGPSLQWRPISRMHLDLVPLLGTTGDSPRVEVFIVFGIDFGRASNGKEILAPTSVRGR
jgi:hypothetical protein